MPRLLPKQSNFSAGLKQVQKQKISPSVVIENARMGMFLEMEESDSSTMTARDSMVDNESVSSSPKPKKRVSFTALHIREYSQVLGDHPCCGIGPPISLGWDFEVKPSISLDDYEGTRVVRRSRDGLRLSFEDRREILEDKYSDKDVRRAQRHLQRERRDRRKKALDSFFHPTTCPE